MDATIMARAASRILPKKNRIVVHEIKYLGSIACFQTSGHTCMHVAEAEGKGLFL